MADSTKAIDIPVGQFEFVGGYINGDYQWSVADWARFPGEVKVRINVFAYVNDGHVLDVELGDATPTQGVAWVQTRRASGFDPTIYCGISDFVKADGSHGAVRVAFQSAGVTEPHYWVAHYDGDPTPIPGTVAKQYANPLFTGHHYDKSVIGGSWPGVEEDMTDDELLAALKRIYSGPDRPEEWVKADVRVMIQQDPETRLAIKQAAGTTAPQPVDVPAIIKSIGAKLSQ